MKREILNISHNNASYDPILLKIQEIENIISVLKVKNQIIVITYDNEKTDLFTIISQIRNINGVIAVTTNFSDISVHDEEMNVSKVLPIKKTVEIKKKSYAKVYACVIFICIILSVSIIYVIDANDSTINVFPKFLYNIEEKELFNPTYNQMILFIKDDKTDLNKYNNDTYVCQDYCFDIIRNAKEDNFKAGFVTFSDHSIICFNTTDRGLYFIEPQVDFIFPEKEMDEMISQGFYGIDDVFGTDNCINITTYDIDWSRL